MNIAETYSGEEGAARLLAQGYDEDMVETMHGAGTQALKHRGGMPYNAPFRIGGFYRLTNMLALLDAHVRGVDEDEAYGGRHWDSYTWHTDLPPGHPMVSGQQTLDFDLYTAENANLITLWGMNWIATKMPDGHWLTEAKLHGAKVVSIAPEYQASSSKADRAIVIRPGSDGALALGLAHVIVRDEIYDAAFVKSQTDLPLLVRSDTKKLLQAKDVFPGYTNAVLTETEILVDGVAVPPPSEQEKQKVAAELREVWGDQVVWDLATDSPKAITRDQTGTNLPADIDPALEGEFALTLADGTSISVRPIFDAVKQHLMDSCSPEQISAVTWVPTDAIEELATDIANNPAKTLFVEGMGPNHFFNNDNKDRTIILVAALTNNIGHFGGTVGSYAGNYRLGDLLGYRSVHQRGPLRPHPGPCRQGQRQEVPQDRIGPLLQLRRPAPAGGQQDLHRRYVTCPRRRSRCTSPTRTPSWATPRALTRSSSTSLPKIDVIVTSEWFWTASCEYADIVFGVDSWPERKVPDVFGSVTNPFLHAWPSTPIDRIFETIDDLEVHALIAQAFADETGDDRFVDYWRFATQEDVGRLHPAGVRHVQPHQGLPLRRPARVVQGGHALLHDDAHQPARSSAGSRPRRASPGTRAAAVSSSTATRTSSSSTARTCPCTANRWTARSTSRA